MFFGRLSFILIFINGLLISSSLPNGTIVTKAIGSWFVVSLTAIVGGILLLSNAKSIRLSVTDLLAITILLGFSTEHYLSGVSPLLQILPSVSYGLVYISVRFITETHPLPLTSNTYVEVTIIFIVVLLSVSGAQYLGIMPSYYSGAKVTGMFFNPGPYAIYLAALAVFIFVLCWFSLRKGRYFQSTFLSFLFTTACFFIIISLSRSAWVGLGTASVIASVGMVYCYHPGIVQRYRKYVWVGGAALLLITLPLAYYLFQLKPTSAQGRGLIWSSVLLLIQDHPFSGVGTGNFAARYSQYQAAFLERLPDKEHAYFQLAGDNRYAFNDFLQLIAECGLPAGLLFLLLLVSVAYKTYKRIKNGKLKNSQLLVFIGFPAILVVILVAGLTAYPMAMTPIALLFWSTMAILVTALDEKTGIPFTPLAKKIGGVLLCVIGLILMYHTIRFTKAYVHWGNTLKDIEMALKNRIGRMQRVYPILKDDGNYLLQLGNLMLEAERYQDALQLFHLAKQYTPDKEVYYGLGTCYEKTGQPEEAKKAYGLVKNSIPNLLKPRYLLAMLHYHQHDTTGFLNAAKACLAFEPKVNNMEVAAMKGELKQLLKDWETQPISLTD